MAGPAPLNLRFLAAACGRLVTEWWGLRDASLGDWKEVTISGQKRTPKRLVRKNETSPSGSR
jgi:hypothetical protein